MLTKFLGLVNPFNLTTNSPGIKFFSSTPSFFDSIISRGIEHKNTYPILFTLTSDIKQEDNLENRKNSNLYSSITAIDKFPENGILRSILKNNSGIDFIFIISENNNLNHEKINDTQLIYYINLDKLVNDFIELRTKSPYSFNQILNKSMFISADFTWNEITNKFIKNKFYITGGISTKRHVISSTQRKLCYILNLLDVPLDFSIHSYHNNNELLVNSKPNNNELLVNTKTNISEKHPNKLIKREYSTSSRRIDSLDKISLDPNESSGLSKQTIYFDYSPVFNEIKEILKKLDHKSNEDVQLEIENFLYSTWSIIINNKIDEIASKGTLVSESFKFLHKHVSEFEYYLNNLREDIQRKMNRKKNEEFNFSFKPLFELDNTKIAAIVFNLVIPLICSSTGITRNDLLMRIGNQLFHSWALEFYDKIYLLSYKNNMPIYQKERVSFKDFKISLNIDVKHKGNLGEYLLQELINMGSLLESTYQRIENTKRHESVIKPSSNTLKLFEKSFDIIGFKLPMICKPVDWSDDEDGGFILNNNYHFDEIIHQGFNNITPTTISDKNRIYGQINYMSKIPFKINKEVLNYILANGVEMNLILGSLHPKTEIFEKLENNEKQEILAHNSRYFQEKNILGIAQLFKDVDKIYFPLFFDWRGRIYSDTSYLHFQSLSLAKSLILFANGDQIAGNNLDPSMELTDNSVEPTKTEDSYFWLNVYGANCFGKGAKIIDKNKSGKYIFKSDLSKLSFIDRVNWIKNNHKYIMNLDKDFWLKADEPLLFLAFCLEYKKIHTTLDFKSHLPIQLDATCNGLQHLSIMSANQNLARLVNLLPNTNDNKPFDLYTVALDLIKDKIAQLVIEEPLYINLKFLNLDRSIVKRSIMTIPYNVTITGIVEHLKEFFIRKYKDNTYLYLPKKIEHGTQYISGKDLFKLASIIHSILYETHPELQEVVNYFKRMVSLMSDFNLPVVWITPAGLEIKQKYGKRKSTRVRSGSFKGASYTIVIPSDKIDKVSQESAFMPNLIHSMDASTITLLIEKLKFFGVYNLYTVHDCFATTINNITLVNELVRESFCEIYANDEFLINLHKFFLEYIRGNFPNSLIYNDKFIDDNDLITTEMVLNGKFMINNNYQNFIEIPNLPKTGEFKNFKDNIKKAIYLIN